MAKQKIKRDAFEVNDWLRENGPFEVWQLTIPEYYALVALQECEDDEAEEDDLIVANGLIDRFEG